MGVDDGTGVMDGGGTDIGAMPGPGVGGAGYAGAGSCCKK